MVAYIVFGNEDNLEAIEVTDGDVLYFLLQLLVAKYPIVRVHRFHFRKDLKKFVEEIIDAKEAIEEIEAIGTDLTTI